MAPEADDEDARLFQVWRGSLAVSTNILAKLGSHALDPASAGEAAGAISVTARARSRLAAGQPNRCVSAWLGIALMRVAV